jgi:outer membrane receptor protein involved in Fe transport
VVLSRRQGPFFSPTNAGEQRYKGLETAVGVMISPMVSVYGNTAWYRSRFGEFVIETDPPIAPSYVVNRGATVRPRANIEAVFSVKHISAVQTDRDKSSSQLLFG